MLAVKFLASVSLLIDFHWHSSLDLRVAAFKSTWPHQVKSSRFSSKSPPKFSIEVAAKF